MIGLGIRRGISNLDWNQWNFSRSILKIFSFSFWQPLQIYNENVMLDCNAVSYESLPNYVHTWP